VSSGPAVVGLRCRTTERTAGPLRGVDALAPLLAERAGVDPRMIGSPQATQDLDWEDDLAASRGCLLEAGGQVDDALAAGRRPVLVAGQCAVALSTLPTVASRRPDARVLWLDAHGDFNTPDTTPSGFLGGMCLAGACGRWNPGLDQPTFPPERLVLCGVRDLDAAERESLERSPATVIGAALETLVYLQNALDGRPTYVHLDLDVLDPSVMPAQHPADGGLAPEKLYDLLDAVADSCEVVGLEVVCLEDAGLAGLVADTVAPLLDSSPADRTM
jgi:arginase